MIVIDLSAPQLVSALLNIAADGQVCLLDSCGVGALGSNLLIAGIEPINESEIINHDPAVSLDRLDETVSGNFASFFTISYELGAQLLGIRRQGLPGLDPEPHVFLRTFDTLIVHNYDDGTSYLTGNPEKFGLILTKLKERVTDTFQNAPLSSQLVESNFTREIYLDAIGSIKERIRCGDTYQTNLTQQMTAVLPDGLTPQMIFSRLRRQHPAPFAAFFTRPDSTVVSVSPELFFSISGTSIVTSPIKGTRRRGLDLAEDSRLREELRTSEKDHAENTMIVDLLRNDLGRICDYGSVEVESLCRIEEHPTLFHLVSTIRGVVRNGVTFAEILKALFPCGSITGAPKLSTMRIIRDLEPVERGLSMGAIGVSIPQSYREISEDLHKTGVHLPTVELSVAIRTMVIRDQVAKFNVGGGIVIDSDPSDEYAESLVKAKALLDAIGAGLISKH